MTLLGWNSLLSMGVHMMTTSMLTTCRCVLTLFQAALCLGHCFSISKHPPWQHTCSSFCLMPCYNLNYSAFIHVDVWSTRESPRKLNRMDVCVLWLGSCFIWQGYNSRKEFIAAQGPLPTTVNEFWRMVWEKNVQTLVMLTRCNEQGRVSANTSTTPGSNTSVYIYRDTHSTG